MTNDRKNWLPSDYVRHGWCQRTVARNAEGDAVQEYHISACSWCAIGAGVMGIHKLQQRQDFFIAISLIIDVFLYVWNDAPERTQAEVVAVLEQAEKECGLRKD